MWLAYVLLACIGFGAGAAMQKHGMATRLPGLSVRTFLRDIRRVVRTVFSNPVWLGGLAVNLLGGLFMILAIDTGELSVVQPLTNLNLLVSVVAGVWLLGERLSRSESAGAAGMLAGAVLLSLSGLRSTSQPRPATTAVLIAATIAAFAATIALNAAGRVLRGRLPQELVLAASAGLLFGLSTVYVKVLSAQLAGVQGMAAVLAAVLPSAALWGIVAANVAGFALYQIAFAQGRVAVVSPLCTVSALLMPVGTGVLALAEHLDALRAAGIAVLAGALVLLLRRPAAGAAPPA